MKITNLHGVSLPLAVWLLHDDYDYVQDINYISATSLLKSTKQLILGKRVAFADRQLDVTDLLSARLGHAVHDGQEKAWKLSHKEALRKLGIAAGVIERIVINPTPEQLRTRNDIIPVYIEQRTVKEIDGYRIGGKFDIIVDGRLFDTKTTSVYTWMLGRKDDDYQLQGSIYRWLNPEKISEDNVHINFVFTDWSKAMSRSQKGYPEMRVKEHVVPLLSLTETENWIRRKLKELHASWTLPEDQLPPCNDKELWRSAPTYKFYLDPAKATDPNGRSTKNFDSIADARSFQMSKGGQGTIVTKPGEAKACLYCPAFDICKQKDEYHAA